MNGRKYTFDSLRFYMILIICISHFSIYMDGRCLISPNIAVNYFFLLSGFGLAYNNTEVKQSALCFGISKVKKIYKIYLYSMFCLVPLKIISDVILRSNHIKELFFLVGKIILTPFMVQSLFGYTGITHILNGVCWFFSCLFICYCVYPLFKKINSVILGDYKKGIIIGCGYIFIIWVLVLGFGYIEKISFFNDLVYTNPIIRCWYLGLGSVVGNYFYCRKDCKKNYNDNFKVCNSIIEIIMVVLCVVYSIMRNIILNTTSWGLKELLDIVITLGIFFAFFFENGIVSHFLKKVINRKLGSLSMLIYFFHYPVILYIDFIVKTIFHGYTKLISIISILCTVIITAIIVFVLNYFIDKRKHI